tara:strand:- start:203 stop:691 length:489 start_codon:yes stop_codon:yes gene_type:complete
MGGLIGMLLGGPGFGLIGAVLTQVGKFADRWAQAKEDAAKRTHEIQLLKMNIEARGREMENEQVIAQAQAMADMMSASYRHDASYGPTGPKAAAILKFVRPALTFIALALAAVIVFIMGDSSIDVESGWTIKEQAAIRILVLAEIAFTWWFADRGISKRLGT